MRTYREKVEYLARSIIDWDKTHHDIPDQIVSTAKEILREHHEGKKS